MIHVAFHIPMLFLVFSTAISIIKIRDNVNQVQMPDSNYMHKTVLNFNITLHNVH